MTACLSERLLMAPEGAGSLRQISMDHPSWYDGDDHDLIGLNHYTKTVPTALDTNLDDLNTSMGRFRMCRESGE